MWAVAKIALSAVIIATVSGISQKYPRAGALLLSLPIVSLLAIALSWSESHDLPNLSRIARDTLILVPLGLPFFVPIAYAEKLGLDFWPAFVIGILLASVTIGIWLWLGPK